MNSRPKSLETGATLLELLFVTGVDVTGAGASKGLAFVEDALWGAFKEREGVDFFTISLILVLDFKAAALDAAALDGAGAFLAVPVVWV
jgi:hypothetical protein